MSDVKMAQAKRALKFCLGELGPVDRFGVVKFSTTVTPFRDKLVPASKDYLEAANKWVDSLKVSGGTAIWPALDEALGMRSDDSTRPFTMIFFTDGLPTVDETDTDKIVKKTVAKNSANTRIFTFGVGDDVNAAMLDQLSEATRAVSTYVRPAEDIGDKVASLYGKISHPVLTDVKIAVGETIRLHEIYPPKLPDLFHGNQLIVIGRYTGFGHTAVRLTGMVGSEKKEFIYELTFPERTASDSGKDFVEPLWARRKVGYLLDQIRVNGEKKELIDEVVSLAKRYGIATPYTSYLVVPDKTMPVAQSPGNNNSPRRDLNLLPAAPVAGGGGYGFGATSAPGGIPPGLQPKGAADKPMSTGDFAKLNARGESGLAGGRGSITENQVKEAIDKLKTEKDTKLRAQLMDEVKKFAEQKQTWDDANARFKGGKYGYQTGRLGVNLAEASKNLRNQDRVALTANRQVQGRNCLEIGGVWIDDAYKADTKTVTVKAQSQAYFDILEKHPEMKDVFRLGNFVVWISPSGTALVIDQTTGADKLTDAEIASLFAKK